MTTIKEDALEKIWFESLRIYESRTSRSRELYENAKSILPGGVTYHIRFYKPYPVFIKRAKGSRVWDVDGNAYIDFWMGHGAHILGHAPDVVIREVQKVLDIGTHFGYVNEFMFNYAKLLTSIIPNFEMVRFCNSGTEAVMYTVRLVRAYTKRPYIVKMEGGWHGGYDSLHIGVTPPYDEPESLGLIPEVTKYTLVVPFNDVDILEKVLKKYDVAAIILEPVLGAGGCIEPKDNYLKEVRRLSQEHDVVLVFDEVITGFRLALGGAQQYFNVDADIVVLGKIVGGGFPGAGAFGGKREIMELLDHTKYPNPRTRSFHGGTFTGNVVTMIAGYTMIDHLQRNESVYNIFNSLWNGIAKKIDKVCEDHDRVCWVTGTGSMIGIHFTRRRPENARIAMTERVSNRVYEVLHMYMRTKGILYMTEHMTHLLPSMVHTEKEAEMFIENFVEFLDKITDIKR